MSVPTVPSRHARTVSNGPRPCPSNGAHRAEQDDDLPTARYHARQEGFDLHAGVRVAADARERRGRGDRASCVTCTSRPRCPPLDIARGALSPAEGHATPGASAVPRRRSGRPERSPGRPSSSPATSPRTPTCRPSCRATHRNLEARTRRRCARPSPEALPLWTSSVFRRPQRR